VFLAYFKPPTSWTDVVKRTVHEVGEDNCAGLAAQLAFYFLLSLFPAVLFLVALAAYLPVEQNLSELVVTLGAVAPAELVALLREQLDQIVQGRHASLLTLGIAGAIWSSSAAMVAIIDALNHAYDIAEWRPWWKRRCVAIALTMSLAVFTLIALAFVLIGPAMASRLADWFGLAPAFAVVWQLIRWPVILLSVVLAVDLVYHFAPNRAARFAWITPGALIATGLWVASSFVFKFYVTNVADYAVTYGTIGGVIVTMLWFYVSGLALLIGAELNAVLEAAWRSTCDAAKHGRQAPNRAE
jgi:membrane protein